MKIEDIRDLLNGENGLLTHMDNMIVEEIDFDKKLFADAMRVVVELFWSYNDDRLLPRELIPIIDYLVTFRNFSVDLGEEVEAAQHIVFVLLNDLKNGYVEKDHIATFDGEKDYFYRFNDDLSEFIEYLEKNR